MSEDLPGLDKLKKMFEMEIFDRKKLRKKSENVTEQEISAFIEKHMLPAFEAIEREFDEYYENVRIDRNEQRILIYLIHGKDVFHFSIGIEPQRRVFSVRAIIEFENTYNGVTRNVKIDQFYDESDFDELNEEAMDSEGVIDLFRLNYFTLYEEKKAHIERQKTTVGPE